VDLHDALRPRLSPDAIAAAFRAATAGRPAHGTYGGKAGDEVPSVTRAMSAIGG